MIKKVKDKDLDTDMKKNVKANKKSKLTRVYDRESKKELIYLEDEDDEL